jgi:hypothetical protein
MGGTLKGDKIEALLQKKMLYCRRLLTVLIIYADQSQVSAQHVTGQIASV